MIATTRPETSVDQPVLFVGFELSAQGWKVAVTSGFRVRAWVRGLGMQDGAALDRLLAQARRRFGVPDGAPVVSCYEAGRDGFWVHRWLTARGIQNRVVDSASIERNRRAKQAKTDRLDALKLAAMLVRVWHGETGVWKEVRVPTEAEEAARHVSRERSALVKERTRLRNQMQGWLASVGTRIPKGATGAWWTTVRSWNGAPVAAELQGRLARAATRLAVVDEQIAALEAQQRAASAARTRAGAEGPVERLAQLKGIGTTSAAVLVDEGLVWRAFRNRREVGGILGFTPTPFASGALVREQGISRAGNARLQTTMIQTAWSWVRLQPASPITRWYRARFGPRQRAKKIGIVAVARKLLIVLWRWAVAGVEPDGAIFTTA